MLATCGSEAAAAAAQKRGILTRGPLAAAALLALAAAAAAEPERNGFDLAGASVRVDLILPGGPPRDGIPAIDEPVFESAAEAGGWLEDGDRVIGVSRGGIDRAYPIRILNWHEIVNDDFGGEPVLVTFCPLCGTGIVFAPTGSGRTDFGVSGLLYNSDVLLYDRESESLWSQVLAEAVTGPRIGERLEVIPSRHTTWGAWRERRPGTEVLSRDTGSLRNYDRDPYAGYEKNPKVFFPVAHPVKEGRLHAKERVLGVTVGEKAKAYPFSALAERGEESFADSVAGKDLVVHWDADGEVAWVTGADGAEHPSVDGFWFAWYAFYPDTEVLGEQ